MRRAGLVGLVVLAGLWPAAVSAQTLDDARELHGEGRLAEALAAYAVVARSPDSDPLSAAIAHNNSCVIHMNRGDWNRALESCDAAFERIQPLDNDRTRSRNLNNLGVVNQHLARYATAARYFDAALKLNRAGEDVEGQVINLANLGALHTATGRYSDAIEAHRTAESLAAENLDEPWATAQVAVARINRGVVLERLGEFRSALDLYRQVLTGDDDDPWRTAALQANVGVLYRNLGDPLRAVESFEEAISRYEGLGDRSGLSNAYLNLALVRHLNLAELDLAEVAYREALRLARASGDRTEEIRDLFYLGRLLFETDRIEPAREAYEACRSAATDSGSAEGQWSALAGLGAIAAASGDYQQALVLLENAMDVIENVRQEIGESVHRSGFFGDKRPIFDAAVKTVARLEAERPDEGYTAQAFDIVQRAKARQLLDRLGPESRPRIPQSTAALVDLLDDGTLLEYFVADDTVFLWVVDTSGIRMIDLGPSQPILSRVSRVHDALSRHATPDPTLLEELSAALLGPVAGNLAAADRLRVAPDGRLHYLPFELLPFPNGSTALIVDRLPVNYLPSAATLPLLLAAPPAIERRFVGFGNPTLPDAGADAAPMVQLLRTRFALGPLPHSETELARARHWIGGAGEQWVGPAATETKFREIVSGGARVVHLATHAVIDERHGRGAAVLLAPGENDDGLLYAREIANLDYRATVTVLAACSTALGSPRDGLALTTLTGAFLAAGSSAVLATLWDVEDSASAAFMEQFYFELGRGSDPTAALRRAKLTMRRDSRWNQPAVWAAYVLIGESAPVASAQLVPPWAWLLAGLLLAVALALFARTLRRSRLARRP